MKIVLIGHGKMGKSIEALAKKRVMKFVLLSMKKIEIQSAIKN